MLLLNSRSASARPFVIALTVAMTTLIGGCSGSSSGPSSATTAGVASIPQAGSSAHTVPTTAAAQRPLIRLDTSADEMQRMFDVYDQCLSAHGMPSKADRVKNKDQGEYKEALTACAAKQPDDYQDKMKREDPAAFKDKQREQVKCMRDHGLAIETNSDGWGYTNPGRDMGSAWDKKCERQAFGD